MCEQWEVQVHAGNPNMARVKGPKFRAVAECEGGGWSTDVPTASLIAAAPGLLAALKDALPALCMAATSEARANTAPTGVVSHERRLRYERAVAAISKATGEA